MWFNTALLVLFILSAPSAASCSCGSGASAGFNFLGDPSFDIDMESFDEFSRASYLANKMEVSVSDEIDSEKIDSAEKAGVKERINNISLDLDDGSHFDLTLFPAGEDLFGRGDIALGSAGAGNANASNATSEALGAVGVQEGNRLILEVVSLRGDLYRVDLLGDGSAFSGDYIKITPEGMIIQGTARGGLPKKVVVIGNQGISASMPSSPAQTSS